MNRAQRRRHARHHRHATPGAVYACHFGWYKDGADQAQAQQATHDALLAELAREDRTRLSGVEWRIWTGAQAIQVLDITHPHGGEDLRSRLRDLGGFLIVAMCEATP